MSETHTTVPGDHLSKVAFRHGITPYHPVWDDPENAALRKARRNPNILAVGDLVFIPDPEFREVERVTDQRHQFRLHMRPLQLRIALRRQDGAPLAGQAWTATRDEIPFEGRTGADGLVVIPLLPTSERVVARVGDRALELLVGHLEPIDTVPGFRERLNNLGYAAGRSNDPADRRLRSAVEEFQCDHGLQVDGKVGPATRAALVKAHGC